MTTADSIWDRVSINGCYAKKDGSLDTAVRVEQISDNAVDFRYIVTNDIGVMSKDTWIATMFPFNLKLPKIGSEWVHKNGNIYRVVFLENLENDRQHEYPTSVSYINVYTLAPYNRKLVDWYRSMTPRKLTNAEKNYNEFVTNTIGWTRYASMHTKSSAAEHKKIWIEGHDYCYKRYVALEDILE